ncbi:hypothetical protein JKF63_07147 [Porcisia hertigi]|uniref:RRM domain-containing protein n=1 Tax=Porcisia hertigi TaxID=2761500 RepID=A0A836LKF0_9TRYP|nr:hypothetical protein JKF63_07147 [Porcisia hertigi]
MSIPNTCSNGQPVHVSPIVSTAQDANVAPPGGAVLGAPRSSGDGVTGGELQPNLPRHQLDLYGGIPAFGSDLANAAVSASTAAADTHDGNVNAHSAHFSTAQRHKNLLSYGRLGGDSEPASTVEPAVCSSSSGAERPSESESTVAAASSPLLTTSALVFSPSFENMPHLAIPWQTSGDHDTLAAAAGPAGACPLATANCASGVISHRSSLCMAGACAGTAVEDVKDDRHVNPLLHSQRGQGRKSAVLFNASAIADNGDGDGSVALQAAVDAVVCFDDLVSEDDVVGVHCQKRELHNAGGTCLSHLFRVPDDDTGAHTCTSSTRVALVSPLETPSHCTNGDSKSCQLLSPMTLEEQQDGCRGDESTHCHPQLVSHDPPHGVAAPSSLPYCVGAGGEAIVSPLPSMRARTSPAASAATSTTGVAAHVPPAYASPQMQQRQHQQQQRLYPYSATGATAAANPSIPAPSPVSQKHSSMSVTSPLNGSQQMARLQPQPPHLHHSRCPPSAAPSPHGRHTPPTTMAHPFSAGATEIATQDDVEAMRYVSPPQTTITAAHHHHHHHPSVGCGSMGRSAVLQKSADASFFATPGMGDTGTAVGAGAHTQSVSLLSSPTVQPVYFYQVPQGAMAVEPQQPQGGTNMVLYSSPQAYIGPGHVVGHLSPALPSSSASAATLGDSMRPLSTSAPDGSYRLSALTQHQQQPQVIGGCTLKPSPTAAAVVPGTSSDESDRALRNLYVRNLPPSWNTSMLRELCSRYGTVESAKVVHHPKTNKSLEYGFVLFHQQQSAATCMSMLNQAHFYAEGEEPRVLCVRRAHPTAAPGFLEEGTSEASPATGLRPFMEAAPLLGPGSRAGAAGGMLPHSITHQQPQPTRELHSPCTPMSPTASMVLLSPVCAPHFNSFELPHTVTEDPHRVQAYRHSTGDSKSMNADALPATSVPGGDSMGCTSPVTGASNNNNSSSSVVASRTALPPSLSETRTFITGKGAVATAASEPPLPGLYRDSSRIATPPHLFTHQAHQLRQQHWQESSLAYSSTSATMSVPAGAGTTVTAMTTVPSQCTGYSFNSPLSLSPNDTASLMLLSPSMPFLTVQLPQSFKPPPPPPSATPSSNESSTKPAHAGSASTNTSTRNVYVTNLPPTWNTTTLRELCSQFGDIVFASVAHHDKTNESRGYGFVLFGDERDAASCVRKVHQFHVPNSSHVLSCRFAKEKATPPIAYTMLSPPHEAGIDSLNSGSGSPLVSAAVGGLPTAETSPTTAPVISLGSDAGVAEGILDNGRAENITSVDGSDADAVCMPIDVFCTMQQRVRAQCLEHLSQQQQQQQQQRQGTAEDIESTNAFSAAEVQLDDLENMLRHCVVYGAYVPTQGYGCVRPMDCRRASLRKPITRSSTAAVAADAERLPSASFHGFSTPASSERRSAGPVISAERGDPQGEVAGGGGDTVATATLSPTVVCTHAIAVGRVLPASPAVTGAAAMRAASSTACHTTLEPLHGVDKPNAEALKQATVSEEVSAPSPASPPELWYTCTLFTSPSAAMEFVCEASKTTLGLVRSIQPNRDDWSTGYGGAVGSSPVPLSPRGNERPQDTTPPPPPPSGVGATEAQMRFGLGDQVVVLNSAPPPTSFTSLANTTTTNNTRLHSSERQPLQHHHHYQQQQQQQTQRPYRPQRLHPPHMMPPPHIWTYPLPRGDNPVASTARAGDTSFSPATGLTAALGHPLFSTRESVQQVSCLPYQKPMLCTSSSVDAPSRPSLSDTVHYAYSLNALTSSTAGASLKSPMPLMMVMGGGGGDGGGGGGGSSSGAAPLSFQQGVMASASAGAAGLYSSVASPPLGSPVSSSSVNVSTGAHALAGPASPPLGVTPNLPGMSSCYSAVINTRGLGSPHRHQAPPAPASMGVFAAMPAQASVARGNALGSPTPTVPVPSSPLLLSSPRQAPPPPPSSASIFYPFNNVLYTVPHVSDLSASATSGAADTFQGRPHS